MEHSLTARKGIDSIETRESKPSHWTKQDKEKNKRIRHTGD